MTRPCSVALTGGLASGKSTVAAMLEHRGASVLDADRVVHQLYAPGEAGAAAVRRLFSGRALDSRGGVDREQLASLVSTDEPARRRLERAIHPLVREHVSRWLDELGRLEHRPPAAVVEAALFVETGSYRLHDLLVVVRCRVEQQQERAVARGMPTDRVRALLEAQIPLEEKGRLADVVIDNSGSRAALEAEVDRAWGEILGRCRK